MFPQVLSPSLLQLSLTDLKVRPSGDVGLIEVHLARSFLKTAPSCITKWTCSSVADVFQRVAVDGDHVGVGARRNDSDFTLHVEHFGGAGRCGLDCVHRRHAKIHHAGEFLSHGFGPGHAADVGAEDDLQVRLQRFLE